MTILRSTLLLFFISIQILLSLVTAQVNVPTLKIGLITDIQYADIDPKGQRYYRNSLYKLTESIHAFNQEKLDFVLNLGDVIDRNISSLDSVTLRLKSLQHKIYHTTGNHDYSPTLSNEALFKKLKMPSEYYTFSKKGWTFIVLNTNEVSTYANTKGTWKEQELNLLIKTSKKENRKNAASYNGGISSKQMNWLIKTLEKSTKRGNKVIILSHHPLAFASGFSALNDKELQTLFSKYTCVKAILSGHHHAGDYGVIGGVHYVTAEGMLETERSNSYAEVEFYENQINIIGHGRMTSRTLQLR